MIFGIPNQHSIAWACAQPDIKKYVKVLFRMGYLQIIKAVLISEFGNVWFQLITFAPREAFTSEFKEFRAKRF